MGTESSLDGERVIPRIAPRLTATWGCGSSLLSQTLRAGLLSQSRGRRTPAPPSLDLLGAEILFNNSPPEEAKGQSTEHR